MADQIELLQSIDSTVYDIKREVGYCTPLGNEDVVKAIEKWGQKLLIELERIRKGLR